jgi:tRNA(Ile)-lysidine synthase
VREKVLQYIRERALLRAGNRVAVAVSGGADSVALLRVLLELRAELGVVVSVAHFNHGLRGEQSNADEAFVADLAKHHGVEFFGGYGDVREHAFTSKLSTEAAGRELRYRWFAALAEEQRLDAIATAHTLDDQAETVLLKFLRGAGTRGLAGIFPVVALAGAKATASQGKRGAADGAPLQRNGGAGTVLSSAKADSDPEASALDAGLKASSTRTPLLCKVIRPLSCVSRQQLEDYLTALDQSWREDESNLDRRFLRNRVRHELLPLLEREFNPSIRQTMSDLAEIARGEEEFWQELTERELSAGLKGDSPGLKPSFFSDHDVGLKARTSTVAVDSSSDQNPGEERGDSGEEFDLVRFASLPLALQRRLLKSFAERQRLTLDFEHIERLRRCALGELSKTELPGGKIAVRIGRALRLRLPSVRQERTLYQYVLPVPGEVHISELKLTLRAELVPAEFAPELAPGDLLSLDLVGPELTVRNWQPGDRFWPAHSRSVEKLKRLFAEKRIPAADRSGWPVVLNGDQIVWVRGFPVAKPHQWKREGAAVRIEAISG